MRYYPRYVPVAERRAKAKKMLIKLQKKGFVCSPVEIEGRLIARSFWGKGWCKHVDSFSDYANRLPRGRTYVRNGSVCHLHIDPGHIKSLVIGSDIYEIRIKVKKLPPAKWKSIKNKCSGQIGSILELLQGKLSDEVMRIVTDRENGLFPLQGEIEFDCDCPDWAILCKHVAAALYGVGNRLDQNPELLFLLRGVDAQDLISGEISLSIDDSGDSEDVIAEDQLGNIFGIDIDNTDNCPARNNIPQKQRDSSKITQNQRAKSEKKQSDHRQLKRTPSPTSSKSTNKGYQLYHPTGKTIRQLREKMGLNVKQFAEKLGVTPNTVSKWELSEGSVNMHYRNLKAIRRVKNKYEKINKK